ncbi:MAG: hypothetical protein KIT56_05555 [Gammaproteobacteria bacterium]|nr:hypothetical protein [Gammaproteobacteria bacterium]MCW5583337.1 hypothetical protein [Gammaproteobacteria bacterium]
MRITLSTFIGCLAILMNGYTFAWSEGGCGGGSCGTAYCSPYESNCQCTDPGCNHPQDTNCISRGYCCEAFGNIGAR